MLDSLALFCGEDFIPEVPWSCLAMSSDVFRSLSHGQRFFIQGLLLPASHEVDNLEGGLTQPPPYGPMENGSLTVTALT